MVCGAAAAPWGLVDGERTQRVSRTYPSIPVQCMGDCTEVGVTPASPHAWVFPFLPGEGGGTCFWLARQQDGSTGCNPSLIPARLQLFLLPTNIAFPIPWVSKSTGIN